MAKKSAADLVAELVAEFDEFRTAYELSPPFRWAIDHVRASAGDDRDTIRWLLIWLGAVCADLGAAQERERVRVESEIQAPVLVRSDGGAFERAPHRRVMIGYRDECDRLSRRRNWPRPIKVGQVTAGLRLCGDDIILLDGWVHTLNKHPNSWEWVNELTTRLNPGHNLPHPLVEWLDTETKRRESSTIRPSNTE